MSPAAKLLPVRLQFHWFFLILSGNDLLLQYLSNCVEIQSGITAGFENDKEDTL